MSDDELLAELLERPRPKTPAERAFVAAAIAVYREGRAKGLSPEDAWVRCTDLNDHALLGPVMKAEARLAELPKPQPPDHWRDQMNHYLDGLGPLKGGI